MGFGLFGGKKPEPVVPRMDPAPPVMAPPSMPQFNDIPRQSDLPEIPPVEDLDLPPPPGYPKGADELIGNEPLIPPVEQPPANRPEPVAAPRPVERPKFYQEGPSRRDVIQRIERAPEPKGPLYVPVDDYRAIIDGTEHMRANLKEVSELLGRMNELKLEEDKEFEKWRTELEDIQRKLMYVDKIIFEAS